MLKNEAMLCLLLFTGVCIFFTGCGGGTYEICVANATSTHSTCIGDAQTKHDRRSLYCAALPDVLESKTCTQEAKATLTFEKLKCNAQFDIDILICNRLYE